MEKNKLFSAIFRLGLTLGLFLALSAGAAFAAANDYTVSGGNPASLPDTGAASVALGTITITDVGGDDFTTDPENIIVDINTASYPGVKFDSTVVNSSLTIAGNCTYDAANALTYANSDTRVTIPITDSVGNECAAGQVITILGLKISTIYSTAAPAAAGLITVDNGSTAAGSPITTSSTVTLAVAATDADGTLVLSNATAGGSGTATLELNISETLAANDTITFTAPAILDVSGLTAATNLTGTLEGSSNITCNDSGQVVTCTIDGASAAAANDLTIIFPASAVGIIGASVGSTDITDLAVNDFSATPTLADINSDATVAVTNVTVGDLTATNVAPESLSLSTISPTTFTFTTTAQVPTGATLVVVYPAGWDLAGAAGQVGSALSGLTGTWTATVSGQTLTLTKTGGSSDTAGAKSLTLNGIMTPPNEGSGGTYSITTTTSTPANIETDAAVTADTIIGKVASTIVVGSPTALTVTDDVGGGVLITWKDPSESNDATKDITVMKGTSPMPVSGTPYALVLKGVQKYIDTNVKAGDIVTYQLRASDGSGNTGTTTAAVTFTVGSTIVPVVEEEEEPAPEPIPVELLAVAESGESGTATIEEVAGKVKVTLALTGGAAGASHPAHIHMGTCAATGDIKHNLTAVADGASVTTLELTLAELQAQYPLYINVHASDADLATTVACGNIEAETVLPEVELEGEVVEEAVAVVDGTITEAVSVQNAETGAAVSIAAETKATVDGAAYTGTIAPPVATEKEITAPEGSKAASAVFSVDTGVTGSVVFDKPVTLVFPATGTVSTKKVYTMYTVAADGKLSEPVVCAVKTLDGKKVFECKSSHLTEFVILESEPEVAEEEEEEVAEAPFVDTKTHWSKDFVADLYAKKVVSGKDATHYAPDAYISRAEFTKIVIVGLGISVKEAKDIKDMPFKDVKAGDWALPYIDAAKTAGVIGGYKDGTFKSDAMINRAEAMKILFEAAKIETKNAAAAKFSDVKQSEWYAKYVNYAAEKKIVSGYKDGTFGTDKNLTRGEVAKIVSLLLKDM